MASVFFIFLSMALVAGSAAFFSVLGLAKLFSGAFSSVVVMGGSLEFGKLVITSYLYNFWKTTNIFLKGYLILSIFILSLITSMGIAGFLTSAHEGSMLDVKKGESSLILLEEKYSYNSSRIKEINSQISNIDPQYVTAKQRLMKSFENELNVIQKEQPQLEAQIIELKKEKIEQNSKIGPVIFITQTFGIDENKAILVLIFLLVIVFDPLAIALTICLNKVVAERRDNNKLSSTQYSDTDNLIKAQALDILKKELSS